jgi:hypothetical protein
MAQRGFVGQTGRFRVRLAFVFVLMLAVAVVVQPASAQQGNGSCTALLIGNSKYQWGGEPPLKEPVNDARSLGEELKRAGFDVEVRENLTKAAMQRKIDGFYGKIRQGMTGLLFFSGYGIQANRQSFLIPVDADIFSESEVRPNGISLDAVLAEMNRRGAVVKIAIIDAARRFNPFENRFRRPAAGLAPASSPNGTGDPQIGPPNPYWANLGNQAPGDIGDYFEGVVHLAFNGAKLQATDWYQPTNIRVLNNNDQDFGGSSPLVLPLIQGLDMIVLSAKDGNVYLLDRNKLGKSGGELFRTASPVFTGPHGAESLCAPAYYEASQKKVFAFVTGNGTGPSLVAFSVSGAPHPQLVQEWTFTKPLGDGPSSPVVASSGNPADGALVWVADTTNGQPGRLYGLDALTGTVEFDSVVNGDALPPLPHFAPMTAINTGVFVGTNAGFACFGIKTGV